MPDDRPRPRPYGNRPPTGPPGPRPGFSGPRPGAAGPPRSNFLGSRPAGPVSDAPVSVRLRDGDREVEVHGSPAFCRQTLDDLPSLLARLRGEGGRAAAIALPAPAAIAAPDVLEPAVEVVEATRPATAGSGARERAENGAEPAEAAVLSVLRSSKSPLTISELRRRLPDTISGQAVRRILERAADRVVNVGGTPAAYRAR